MGRFLSDMGHGLWLHDLSQGGRFSQAPGGCTPRAVILSFCSDWFSRVPKKSSKRTRPKKHDLTLFCPFKNQTYPVVHVKFEVWYTRSAGTANGNALSHAPRNLMQQPPKGGNSDVLHVQYWMVGTFKIKDSGGEIRKGGPMVGCSAPATSSSKGESQGTMVVVTKIWRIG